MKTLKANRIEKERLSDKEKSRILGGTPSAGMCGCGCKYENSGGSSSVDNGLANADAGIWSGDAFTCIQPVVITPDPKEGD